MDPGALRQLKEKLLEDIKKWQLPGERGFQDIVRNAIDIDTRILQALMEAFDANFKEVRGWGSGATLPEDFKRIVIVGRVRKLLESEVNAVTEA